MSETNDSKMAAFLSEHPRMIGVLFTIGFLVTQAQPVLADSGGGAIDGP